MSKTDSLEGLTLQVIIYESQGLAVKGWLLTPEDNGGAPFPPAVYCRGGIRRVGMVRLDRLIPLARRGYAVFAPLYRGNDGGEGREDFAGEDRHDVFAALEWLQRQPFVRPGRVPLVGFSRGSLMALRAAAEHPLAGPVVSWGGVTDLLLTYEERVDLRRMLKRVVGHPAKQREAYIERSPLYWPERVRVPVMIVHGDQDAQVGLAHAERFAEALKRCGNPPHMLLLADAGHRLPPERDEYVWDRIDAFFRRAGGDVAARNGDRKKIMRSSEGIT